MSLVAGLNLIMQGVEPNAQPPRIQVALATGKLVLPEQGCLGQGGVRRNPIMQGVKTSRLTRREIRRGASDQRKRSHDATRTCHEPCCWSESD